MTQHGLPAPARTLRIRPWGGRAAAALLVSLALVATTQGEAPASPEPSPSAPASPTEAPTEAPAASPTASPTTDPAGPARPVAARQSKRPNVVVLMADDMRRADLRFMPKTRKLLGKRGVTFPKMISQHPLCCPARAEFLTGQLAQNNKVRANEQSKYGGYRRLRTQRTIATWLKSAGYQTGFVGKHLNGYRWGRDGRDPGWTLFQPIPVGTYEYFGFTAIENNRFKNYPTKYVTDYLGDEGVRFVEQFHKRDNKPFFMWVSHVAPHLAFDKSSNQWVPPPAPKRYAGQFGNSALDSLGKPSFNEGNVKDKPKLLRKRKVRVASVRARHDGRVRSLRAVDDANARVVQTLARTGELKNTVVMFTSDNGYLMGEHRWMEKTLGYEESLQVPLVVRGPKVPRNEKAVSTATVVDLASTIVDLANADPDLTLDGQSLVPLMRRPATAQRTSDTVLIQGGPRSRHEDKWGWLYRGVRTDRYTFVKYGNKKKELYDRVEDPFQLTNVSGKAAYDAVEADLKRRLNALVDCAGRSCNATFGPDLAPH